MSGENKNDQNLKKIPGVPAEEKEAALDASDLSTSAKESDQIGSAKTLKELEKEALGNEHTRKEKFKDHLEKIIVCGMYFISLGAAIFAAIWGWHMTTPNSWQWLEPAQLDRIQNLVTGGVLASLITNQFQNRLGKN